MQAPPEPSRLKGALVAVRGAGGAWAVPGSAVVAIEASAAGTREAALDVAQWFGESEPAAAETSRVLVLDVAGRRVRLLTRGALSLLEPGQVQLLVVPEALATPLISHVGVEGGSPTLCVLSPERLLEVAHAEDPDA